MAWGFPERLGELAARTRAEAASGTAAELLDPATDAGRASLEALLGAGRVTRVLDTLADQVADLAESREPGRRFTAADRAAAFARWLDGRDPAASGIWAFYPWSGVLAHLLPPNDFAALRTDRNRYKINAEEQALLARARIGIIGQSVGNAVALTLAMEGIGGELRLADPDALGLSNLNRLRAGVVDLGCNKAVLAARQIAALDPYLSVRVFPVRIDDATLDGFLLEGGKLDLLFDECDDLLTKVRCRERARELGIPVLMSTDDRGMMDVERFDREPTRPLFHGVAGDLNVAVLKGLQGADKVPYVLRILGEENLSPRTLASLVEMDETLSSFPQIASEVALGGAQGAHAARKILLGELRGSGRWYVDLDEILRDGADAEVPDAAAPLGVEACDEALRAPAVGPLVRAATLSDAAIRSLVSYAILAPSPHNGQAWRFRYRGGRLQCLRDPARSGGILDFGHGAAHLALGAAAENVVEAAAGMGFEAVVHPFPDPGDPLLACEIAFAFRGTGRESPRLRAIPERATNRRRGPRVPLDPADAAALEAAVTAHGGRLQWVAHPDALEEAGQILGGGDRVAYLSKDLHAELMDGVRWTPEEVLRTRDGIDVATLEMSAADVAGLRVVSRWSAMRLVGMMGSGRVLEQVSRKAVASASALGLVTMPGNDPAAFLRGGRAMEAAWLEATARGLAFHPLAMMPYLFAHLERGTGEGFSAAEQAALRALRQRYRALFDVPEGWCEPILFRLAGGVPPPSARALRRPVDDVLDP